MACRFGHTAAVQYLLQHSGLTKEDIRAHAHALLLEVCRTPDAPLLPKIIAAGAYSRELVTQVLDNYYASETYAQTFRYLQEQGFTDAETEATERAALQKQLAGVTFAN